jgi:hypothetical protein
LNAVISLAVLKVLPLTDAGITIEARLPPLLTIRPIASYVYVRLPNGPFPLLYAIAAMRESLSYVYVATTPLGSVVLDSRPLALPACY